MKYLLAVLMLVSVLAIQACKDIEIVPPPADPYADGDNKG